MRISDWSSDVCSSDLKRLWLGIAIYTGVVLLSLLIGGMLSVLPAEANEGLVEASGLTREVLAAATQAYAQGDFMQVTVQRTQDFMRVLQGDVVDRKSKRLNSSH